MFFQGIRSTYVFDIDLTNDILIDSMTVENLKEVMATGKPFTIQMADGQKYEVPHPDFVAFTRKRTTIAFYDEDGKQHILPLLPLLLMSGISSEYQEPVPGSED